MSNNISLTFLQVLLKKDFLTLWRNKGFLLAFIVMPLLLMTTFVNLQDQTIDRKDKFGEGSMIEDIGVSHPQRCCLMKTNSFLTST